MRKAPFFSKMNQRGRGKEVVNTSKALELLDKDIEKYRLSQQKGDGKHITQTKYRHNTTQDMSTLKTIQKQTSFSQSSSSLHVPLSSSSKQATYKPILSSATPSFTRNPSKPNPQRKQTSRSPLPFKQSYTQDIRTYSQQIKTLPESSPIQRQSSAPIQREEGETSNQIMQSLK